MALILKESARIHVNPSLNTRFFKYPTRISISDVSVKIPWVFLMLRFRNSRVEQLLKEDVTRSVNKLGVLSCIFFWCLEGTL